MIGRVMFWLRDKLLRKQQTKLCVPCQTHHPLSHFDKAPPEFPTRDGYNYNCRKSVKKRGYKKLQRLPTGRVEFTDAN